jgi:hypothetical protein
MNNVHWYVVIIIAVLEIQSKKGLSLTDIVSAAHEYVCRTSMPPDVMAALLDKLADIEYRLAFGTNEKLQLAALVGIFNVAKEQIANPSSTTTSTATAAAAGTPTSVAAASSSSSSRAGSARV